MFILVFFEVIVRFIIRVIRILRALLRKLLLRKYRLLPRRLRRMKLNGKGKRKHPRKISLIVASLVAWLDERELGIAFRYLVILLLAAMPIVPYLMLGAISLSRATKSRYGYLFIFIGVIVKVLVTVHAIYHL